MSLPWVETMCKHDKAFKRDFRFALEDDHRCHMWGVIHLVDKNTDKLVRLLNVKNDYFSFIDLYSMYDDVDSKPHDRIPRSYLMHESEFVVRWVGKGEYESCPMHGCELENEYLWTFVPSFEAEDVV